MKMTKKFYTANEIAGMLRISIRTLYKHINDNRNHGCSIPLPPYIKVRGRILFDEADVDTWLQELKLKN